MTAGHYSIRLQRSGSSRPRANGANDPELILRVLADDTGYADPADRKPVLWQTSGRA
jgi:hypothetical protein